jgi:hypothetical protein
MYYGTLSGILPETVGLNAEIQNVIQLLWRRVILAGVTADGQPNTKRVTIFQVPVHTRRNLCL